MTWNIPNQDKCYNNWNKGRSTWWRRRLLLGNLLWWKWKPKKTLRTRAKTKTRIITSNNSRTLMPRTRRKKERNSPSCQKSSGWFLTIMSITSFHLSLFTLLSTNYHQEWVRMVMRMRMVARRKWYVWNRFNPKWSSPTTKSGVCHAYRKCCRVWC